LLTLCLATSSDGFSIKAMMREPVNKDQIETLHEASVLQHDDSYTFTSNSADNSAKSDFQYGTQEDKRHESDREVREDPSGQEDDGSSKRSGDRYRDDRHDVEEEREEGEDEGSLRERKSRRLTKAPTATTAAGAASASKLDAPRGKKPHPPHRNPHYVKLLDTIKSPMARAELEKLVEALEDKRNCAVYKPHQLGPLLCALFPYKGKSKRHTRPRTAQELELLLPRPLEFGPVPTEFNRRLAYTDDPDLAREMAAEDRERRSCRKKRKEKGGAPRPLALTE